MARAVLTWVVIVAACGDSEPLGGVDAGATADAAEMRADATSPDAAARDVGTPDASAIACDPLASATSSASFAHVEGLLSVLEFYSYTPSRNETFHWRQWSVGAFSAALEPTASEPYLYAAIPADGCIVRNIAAATASLTPFRNLGTHLKWTTESGDEVIWAREVDEFGALYRLPSGAMALKFSDPAQTPFDQRWTWSTPGDLGGAIRPASAEIQPTEDFQVTPPISTSSVPLALFAGLDLRWTAPVRTPARVSLVMARATSPAGDARAVICRPADDGSFVITQAMIDALGPVPGLSFTFNLSRTQHAPFCNEGIRDGLAVHTVAHLGTAVVR